MIHTFLLKDVRGPEPERLVTCRAMLMCFWVIPLATVIGEWNSGKKFILSCSANRIVFTWLGNITGVHVTSENVLGKFFVVFTPPHFLYRKIFSPAAAWWLEKAAWWWWRYSSSSFICIILFIT